ncbi:MAG: hypothetical protein ABFC77_07795 [Thermoguttaceae bacterium]
MSSNGTHDVSDSRQALTPTPFPVCTRVCTRVCTTEAENANADTLEAVSLDLPQQDADVLGTGHHDDGEGIDQGDTLAKLADALLMLSPTDRKRLATMLTTPKVER